MTHKTRKFYYSEKQKQVILESCHHWDEPLPVNYFKGTEYTEAISIESNSLPSWDDAVLIGEGCSSHIETIFVHE
jgi:hypothetical protein